MSTMAKRRRRRVKSRALDSLIAAAAGVVVVIGLIDATRGWVLLVLPTGAAITGVWWWVRRRARRRSNLFAMAVARDLDALLAVSPSDFELIVGQVLEHFGYRLTAVGRSGDRGVDLDGVGPEGERWVIQCKQYATRPVGGPAVRNLAGAMAQAHAQRAMLVTTATFTREAIVAGSHLGIRLVDGVTLARWASAAHGDMS